MLVPNDEIKRAVSHLVTELMTKKGQEDAAVNGSSNSQNDNTVQAALESFAMAILSLADVNARLNLDAACRKMQPN